MADLSNLLSLLRRHYVTVSCVQELTDVWPGQEVRRGLVISGFVISILDQWFFMTAGHVLDTIQESDRHGVRRYGWQINDSGAYGGKHHDAIPFAFDAALYHSLRDDDLGIDYGLIYLRPMYRDLLKSNGIVAVTEREWGSMEAGAYDVYSLIGVPAETVELAYHGNDEGLVISDSYVQLTPEPHPPSVLIREHPRLYFRLPPKEEAPVESIEGMSGGPVFGWQLTDGPARYWLVGLQSGWERSSRVTAVCPIRIFGRWLTDVLRRAEDDG